MNTTDTTTEIPAAHRSVLKGAVANAMAEHAGSVEAPSLVAAEVARALAELGYGALLAELDEVRRRYTFDTAELKKRVAELERENGALTDRVDYWREGYRIVKGLTDEELAALDTDGTVPEGGGTVLRLASRQLGPKAGGDR